MLRPKTLPSVPTETARVAHAAFPKSHPYLGAANEMGAVFTDAMFAALFRRRGRPALAPWRPALATILQFAEGLSDVRFVPSKPWAGSACEGWGAREGGVPT